jgi:exodeoxyribonuclease VII large subunit
MKRHLEEAENRFRSTWAYRFDADRIWLDDAETGILQGTRKLLDSTKSYLLGYATTLLSRVQNRLTGEKSKIAVSRNLIATVPISLVKRANERLNERTERFRSGYRRQIKNTQDEFLKLKNRFQIDRYIRRITHEQKIIWDFRNRFLQRFKSEINIRKQQIGQLSKQFKLESVVKYIGNEKIQLDNKSATLRTADPVTSLKRGFSLVYADNGDLVKSIKQIRASEKLRTEVSDGHIVSTVNKTERK